MKINPKYSNELSSDKHFMYGQKALVVNREGKVLLLKRSSDSTKSATWNFPGGRLDFGESLIGGLKRELAEEVGIVNLEIGSLLAINTLIRDIDKNTQLVRTFWLVFSDDEVVLNDEHSEYIWESPENCRKYNMTDKYFFHAIENYMKLCDAKTERLQFVLGDGLLR